MLKPPHSKRYLRYVLTTTLYGICALLGMAAVVIFGFEQRWFITVIAVLFTLVALDNFFCGDRCRIAGGTSEKSHYVIPPFIKGNKK